MMDKTKQLFKIKQLFFNDKARARATSKVPLRLLLTKVDFGSDNTVEIPSGKRRPQPYLNVVPLPVVHGHSQYIYSPL